MLPYHTNKYCVQLNNYVSDDGSILTWKCPCMITPNDVIVRTAPVTIIIL